MSWCIMSGSEHSLLVYRAVVQPGGTFKYCSWSKWIGCLNKSGLDDSLLVDVRVCCVSLRDPQQLEAREVPLGFWALLR